MSVGGEVLDKCGGYEDRCRVSVGGKGKDVEEV